MVCRRQQRLFARDDIFGSTTSCGAFLFSGGATSMGVNTLASLALRSSQRLRSSLVELDNMLNWLSIGLAVFGVHPVFVFSDDIIFSL